MNNNVNNKHINVSDIDKSPWFLLGLIMIIILTFAILINAFGKRREVISNQPDTNIKENNEPDIYVEKDKYLTCILDNNTVDYTYRATKIFTYKNSGINKVDINYAVNNLTIDGVNYVESEKNYLMTNDAILKSELGFTSTFNEQENGFTYQSIFDLNSFDINYINQGLQTDHTLDFNYTLNQNIDEIRNDLTNSGYYCYNNANY